MPEIVENSPHSTKITVLKERRHLFNGYTPRTPTRPNRPFKKRRISTLNIIFFLTVTTVSTVFYIGNIITVNRLAGEIEDLKASYSILSNANEFLQSEINQKSTMERITKIASEQMGMVYPKQPPVWFSIDEEE